MTRLQMRHHDDARFGGIGLVGLAVGLLAGLAAGAYLAHCLGGGTGLPKAFLRRRRAAVAGGLEPEAIDHETADLDDEDETYDDVEADLDQADDEADDEAGDDWDDGDEEEGDEFAEDDPDDAFASADPQLEDRVLEAFTNDPILSERAVDIGAIRPATIELIGTVFSDEEYDYATTLTGGVPGVEKVVNRLVVRDADDHAATKSAADPIVPARPQDSPPTPL